MKTIDSFRDELINDTMNFWFPRAVDEEYGGLFYFLDVYDKPVQEYWHDMKFWWPHDEAIIATLMAFMLTGDEKYSKMHREGSGLELFTFRRFRKRRMVRIPAPGRQYFSAAEGESLEKLLPPSENAVGLLQTDVGCIILLIRLTELNSHMCVL